MKKIYLVSFLSLVFFLMSSAVAYLLKYTAFANEGVYLLIGIAFMIAGVIVAALAGDAAALNIVSGLLNAVSLGFYIRAWYVFRGIENGAETLLLLSLVCAGFILLFHLLLYIPFIERHANLFGVLYVVLVVIMYFILLGVTKTTYLSTLGFYGIIDIIFFVIYLLDDEELGEVLKQMNFATFGLALVALIIGLAMLGADSCDCDGGCCDGCDCGGGSGTTNSPHKRKVSK